MLATDPGIQINQLFLEVWDDINKATRIGAARAAEKLTKRVQATIDAQGARGGQSKWPPFKRPPKPPRPLLKKTGRLYNSFQAKIVTNDDGLLIQVESDVPYAGYQNFGTRTIPARPFMIFFDEDADVVAHELEAVEL